MSDEVKIDGGEGGGAKNDPSKYLTRREMALLQRQAEKGESSSLIPFTGDDRRKVRDITMAQLDVTRSPRHVQAALRTFAALERLNLMDEGKGEGGASTAVNVNVNVLQQQVGVTPEEFAKLEPAERIRKFQELAAAKAKREA